MKFALSLLLVLTACGTDGSHDAVPTITANGEGVSIQKGEKGDKGDRGEKGDKGDPGEPGPAGKDGIDGKEGAIGAQGTAGKDGETAPSGTWKDPITGRLWMHIHGKYNASQFETDLCKPWKMPSAADFQAALQHGILQALPMTNPAGTERVWVNERQPNTDYKAVLAIESDISLIGTATTWPRASLFRVYCVKD